MEFFKKVKSVLRGWKSQPSKEEAKRLSDYYKQLTAEVTDEKVLDLLDRPEKFDLLMLYRIAEYADMGKMKAIVYAFKLGYLAGKGGAGNE